MKFGRFEIEDAEVQMAPMIDMVFLLLIFFIVASHFDQLERVEIEAPVADNAAVAKDFSNRRSITIAADGAIFFGSQKHVLADLEPMVRKTRAQVPGLKIYLRADRRVHHKQVRDVMKACAAAGAVEIIFATLED